jgi:UDP-N-acetyl-D-mannosaminuronic acid transferase (WecB/TagA/CpsF family)
MKSEHTSGYGLEDIQRGFSWYAKHEEHVDKLMKGVRNQFPVSGSDIRQPALWKAEGWVWFFQTFNNPWRRTNGSVNPHKLGRVDLGTRADDPSTV